MFKVPELKVEKSQNRFAYHKQTKILQTPYTYLIFQSGQIKILGQADALKKKAFPYQIYGKNKDLWVFRQKFFLPLCYSKEWSTKMGGSTQPTTQATCICGYLGPKTTFSV